MYAMGSSTSEDGNKFPQPEIAPEERARRLTVEVERLARLPNVEWRFYLKTDGVAEKHGMSLAEMTILIEATIKEREKKAREDRAEKRRSEQRAEKEQSEARRKKRAVSRSGPLKRPSALAKRRNGSSASKRNSGKSARRCSPKSPICRG